MGNTSSSLDSIDGLGLKVPYPIPRPTEESKTKLEQLIKANHSTFAVLFNHKKFHNHVPHYTVSSYFLGATPNHLTAGFEDAAKVLVPWEEDSPQEVTKDDWQDFIGNVAYERGFYDYFNDRMDDAKWNWKSVAVKHFKESPLLFDNLVSGLLHPLIHLGYAAEIDNAMVASEALNLAAIGNLDLSPVRPTTSGTEEDILKIVNDIHNDSRLDGIKDRLDGRFDRVNLFKFFAPEVKEYAGKLKITDIKTTIKDLLRSSAFVFSCSHKDGNPQYSFFLLHLLTASHALYEIVNHPHVGDLFTQDQYHRLLQSMWIMFVVTYITEHRPLISRERVDKVTIESREAAWKDAIDQCLNGEQRYDLHFPKAMRALLVCDQLFPEDGEFYAMAAVTFGHAFNKNGYGNNSPSNYLDIEGL